MLQTNREPASANRILIDPRRELLDRVLGSSWFSKSERLSELLVYICELGLEG